MRGGERLQGLAHELPGQALGGLYAVEGPPPAGGQKDSMGKAPRRQRASWRTLLPDEQASTMAGWTVG